MLGLGTDHGRSCSAMVLVLSVTCRTLFGVLGVVPLRGEVACLCSYSAHALVTVGTCLAMICSRYLTPYCRARRQDG